MEVQSIVVSLTFLLLVNAKVVKKDYIIINTDLYSNVNNSSEVFNDVYKECFVTVSFACVQRKTLMYLKQLNNLSEVSIVGDYVKFVKINTSEIENKEEDELSTERSSEEMTKLIDEAVDRFFNSHVIKFSALGNEISFANNVEEFVGRKKRKGGGGGGMMSAHDGGHFGHKKMMMMAMMCMKMKMMMMIPAMMGMMGMMSFKGMLFSMMSFMASKMMLLMKILEKKGGLGGASGGGVGGDGGWAAGGGSGGAWMPAGGQDFGGGGGYDANGQWQSRSIIENKEIYKNRPVISYIAPVVTYNNPNKLNKLNHNNNDVKNGSSNTTAVKSRTKRSVMDVLQNSYTYWLNKLLGINNNNRRTSNIPKFKIVNGVKYVYYPYPYRQMKIKTPKEIRVNKINNTHEEPLIITAADFNKGEIMEGVVESKMMRRKFQKVRDNVNETVDENPWE